MLAELSKRKKTAVSGSIAVVADRLNQADRRMAAVAAMMQIVAKWSDVAWTRRLG